MEIVVLIACLVALSLSMETVGTWGRFFGAVAAKPTLGYSLHVRIATTGRLLNFAALPLLGFVVDTSEDPNKIILIGLILYTVHTFICFLCLQVNLESLGKLFARFLNVTIDVKSLGFKSETNKKLLMLTVLATCIQISAIILINTLAIYFKDYRATILQSIGFVTMVGTFVHVYLIDPILAQSADRGVHESFKDVKSYILGRILASSVLALVSLFILI